MDPDHYYKVMPEKTSKHNLLFITDFPLIYPLLAKTDIYLGDVSSIGYDFLFFQKPMFFFNPFSSKKSSPQHVMHERLRSRGRQDARSRLWRNPEAVDPRVD